jgi:3-methylfumaryl-CoA hydratase
MADLKSWVGRSETTSDVVTLAPARAMLAVLDDKETRLDEGSALPPMWHWLYFLPAAPQSEIGPDGHPSRGGFMPPVPLPRRMFAGARLRFPGALAIGKKTERMARIESVEEKQGQSGPLVFVTVRIELRQDGRLCVEEVQDIVYRAMGGKTPAPKTAPLPEPPKDAWVRDVAPDPVLLFRYSALTFNGHRIHYDRTYAMEVEGYPGLIVHGPLTATLMTDVVRRSTARRVAAFSFRARAPLFDLAPFRVQGVPSGNTVDLAAIGPDGAVAMTGTAELA